MHRKHCDLMELYCDNVTTPPFGYSVHEYQEYLSCPPSSNYYSTSSDPYVSDQFQHTGNLQQRPCEQVPDGSYKVELSLKLQHYTTDYRHIHATSVDQAIRQSPDYTAQLELPVNSCSSVAVQQCSRVVNLPQRTAVTNGHQGGAGNRSSATYYSNAATAVDDDDGGARMEADTYEEDRQCDNCHTRNTPLWRRFGPNKFLCNACGLYQRVNGNHRPLVRNVKRTTQVVKRTGKSSSRVA